jgi:hypothetical protein
MKKILSSAFSEARMTIFKNLDPALFQCKPRMEGGRQSLIGKRRIADSSPTRESSTFVNLMKALWERRQSTEDAAAPTRPSFGLD